MCNDPVRSRRDEVRTYIINGKVPILVSARVDILILLFVRRLNHPHHTFRFLELTSFGGCGARCRRHVVRP